jgi:transcriptional regulator with XRE-family HTH domain
LLARKWSAGRVAQPGSSATSICILPIVPNIGPHLHDLRRRRHLTVRQLAVRSGVAHTTISLIERNKTSPSIDTLSAILGALGSTLVGFFAEVHDTVPYSPFYSRDELVEIGNSNRISYRSLGINHPNRSLLMLHETYEVGADTGEAFSHSAQEAGFVLVGEVEVTVGDNVRILCKGDGYYFDSQTPHRFRNVGKERAEIISAITPPTY